MKIRLTGAIFCGGKSSRMGRPKPGIVLQSGLSMIETVYEAMKGFCEEIVLIGDCDGIPDPLNSLRRISDNYKDLGPIGGLEALLRCGLSEEYLVSPCDLFNVNQDVYAFLTSQEGKLPIVLKSKRGIEPLIGRYSSRLLPTVQEQINKERLSMHELLSSVKATVISIPEEHTLALSNANTLEDLSLT